MNNSFAELERVNAEWRKMQEFERRLSDAYLRLRVLIPGAFETPHAPTAEQVWAVTEDALKRVMQELMRAQQA